MICCKTVLGVWSGTCDCPHPSLSSLRDSWTAIGVAEPTQKLIPHCKHAPRERSPRQQSVRPLRGAPLRWSEAETRGGKEVCPYAFMLSRAYPLTLSLLPALASGHGAVITPRSRNSVDYLVGINSPKDWAGDWECTNISSNGQGCHNGQAAFYYSQGCFIGCKECDHLSGRRQVDLCGSGQPRAIDPKYRTLNRNATPGSDLDIYRHNPWAAPGTAPVADACGLAGGTPWPQELTLIRVRVRVRVRVRIS